MNQRVKRWVYPLLAGAAIYFIVWLIKRTIAEDLATGATVWAAFGTLAAVAVALILAQSAAYERQASEKKKHAAAAIIVSRQLYKLRAILDVVSENASMVRLNKAGYANWLSRISYNLGQLNPVIQDKHLHLVTELPSMDLFTLSVCDEWFNEFRSKHLLPEATLANHVIEKFDTFIDELIRGQQLIAPASVRLHELSEIPGPPPWSQYEVPSWAVPREG